jgi:hypothetical protein
VQDCENVNRGGLEVLRPASLMTLSFPADAPSPSARCEKADEDHNTKNGAHRCSCAVAATLARAPWGVCAWMNAGEDAPLPDNSAPLADRCIDAVRIIAAPKNARRMSERSNGHKA